MSEDTNAIKVEGGAKTGKTAYLLKKTVHLLEEGIAPHDVCIIVNTEDAAQDFKRRLGALTDKTAQIDIVTMKRLCLGILSNPEAEAVTGRQARVLNDDEYKFLLEDIKTLGQRPGRLKSMLNFFYSQWSLLEPEEEWLLPQEEHHVRQTIEEHLRARNALIAAEVAPLCAHYLKGVQENGDPAIYRFVMVDDFQNLSKASQAICGLIAGEQLIVTGNEAQFNYCSENFPHKEGFLSFEDIYPHAEHVTLTESLSTCATAAMMGRELRNQEGMSKENIERITLSHLDKSGTHVKWATPAEEFIGIATYLENLLKSDETLEGSDCYLVSPNKAWSKQIANALKQKGIFSSIVATNNGLGGDPRDASKCRALIMFNKLNLIADKNDIVAWRSWCGFDNYLCYSGAWCRLEEWARQNNQSVLEALSSLEATEGEPFLEAHILRERYQAGITFIQNHENMCGYGLLKEITGASDGGELAHIISPLDGDESATTLYQRAKNRMEHPRFADNSTCVRIGSYENLQGLSPRVLIVTGAVDGFTPSRDCFDVALLEKEREESLKGYRRVFYNAITKASQNLILSSFQKADLETAERFKMKVRRIRMDHGKRMAMLSPSVFISEAAGAAPSVVSGQQFLAEL